MVKKVRTNLDFSKTSHPDSVPVEVLKNRESELSYILAELFNKCLKESFFPDGGKVSLIIPTSKIVGKRSTAKNYHSVSLHYALLVFLVFCKVFEKILNNRIVDHLEKCGLFFDFQYGLGLLDQQ